VDFVAEGGICLIDTGFRKFWWISWISWITIFRQTDRQLASYRLFCLKRQHAPMTADCREGCDDTPHQIHRTHRSLIIFRGVALPLPRPNPGWPRLNCLTNTDPNLLPLSHVQ